MGPRVIKPKKCRCGAVYVGYCPTCKPDAGVKKTLKWYRQELQEGAIIDIPDKVAAARWYKDANVGQCGVCKNTKPYLKDKSICEKCKNPAT